MNETTQTPTTIETGSFTVESKPMVTVTFNDVRLSLNGKNSEVISTMKINIYPKTYESYEPHIKRTVDEIVSLEFNLDNSHRINCDYKLLVGSRLDIISNKTGATILSFIVDGLVAIEHIDSVDFVLYVRTASSIALQFTKI